MGKKSKRLYNKPTISQVRLLPEEAVLQNCKAASATNRTNQCGTLAKCSNKDVGS
jgi:hypothetical protein